MITAYKNVQRKMKNLTGTFVCDMVISDWANYAQEPVSAGFCVWNESLSVSIWDVNPKSPVASMGDKDNPHGLAPIRVTEAESNPPMATPEASAKGQRSLDAVGVITTGGSLRVASLAYLPGVEKVPMPSEMAAFAFTPPELVALARQLEGCFLCGAYPRDLYLCPGERPFLYLIENYE